MFATYTDVTGTAEDTVQLTVEESCTFTPGTRTATIDLGTMAAGSEFAATNGVGIGISCNDVDGWTLNATATSLRLPASATSDAAAAHVIEFGAYPASIPASGSEKDAVNSVWSAAISIDSANADKVTIATGWDNYTGATASDTTILSSKQVGGSGADATDVIPVSNMTVTPSYKAYASTTQAAGTYQGTMTYNFATGTHN